MQPGTDQFGQPAQPGPQPQVIGQPVQPQYGQPSVLVGQPMVGVGAPMGVGYHSSWTDYQPSLTLLIH